MAGARSSTTPIWSCSPAHWLCPYPAGPTAACTCCAPTAPTDYGRLPLVLVAVAPPHNLGGAGPIEVVETHTVPAAVVAAVDRLLQPTGQTPDRKLLTGRAGVDDEAPPGLLAVSSADLRGVF